MTERPWTPGPWIGEKSSGWMGRNDNEGFFVMQAPFADFELIALAPEMAEAILAFDMCPGHAAEPPCKMCEVAEKLRAVSERGEHT